MGDETDRAGRRFRRVMAAAAVVLVGSWLAMTAATGLLRAMSPGTCRAGGIIDAQYPGATRSELTETVTGWVLFDLGTRGYATDPVRCALATDPTGTAPTAAAAGPDQEPRALDVRPGLSIARAWLLTDLLGFMPAYVVLLLGAQRWAVQRRLDRSGSTSVPAGLVRAFAAHPALALAAVGGGLADAAENLQILARVGGWWRVGEQGPEVVIGVGALRLIHLAGGIKTALVAAAALGALVSIADWLAGRARPVLDAGRHLWVQAAVAAVFTVGLVVPGQSSDAVRRLSPTQWAASLLALGVLAAVLALTSYGALKPQAAGPAFPRATGADRGAGLRIRWLDGSSPRSPADWWRWLQGRPGALARLVTLDRLRAARVGLTVTGAGAALIVASTILPWQGLRVPGGLIALVGLASLVIDAATVTRSRPEGADDDLAWRVEPGGAAASGCSIEATDPTDPADPADPADPEVRHRADPALRLRIAALVGGLVPAALAVVAVRATATDVLFLAPGGARQSQLALRLAVGLGLLAAVPAIVHGLQGLARRVAGLDDGGRRRVLGALALLHAPAALFHDPDIVVGHAHRLGALVLLAVFLSGFCLIGSMADTLSVAVAEVPWLRPYVVPSGLRQLSLRRPPFMGLLVVWVALSPLGGSLNGYHTVPSLPDRPAPTPLRSNSFIQAWAAARGLDTAADTTPVATAGAGDTLPVLLVAASGGGIRAAYWTAAVVDCLIERTDRGDDPCADPATDDERARAALRRDRFLLGSGVSGGSLGLTAYVTADGPAWLPHGTDAGVEPLAGPAGRWYAERLGDDYLAPVVAAWLFNDGLNTLLRPTQGVDRGAVLERAWAASWPGDELARPWFNAQATGLQPLLVLNGYSVNNGCRFAVSPVNTNARRSADTCRAPESDGETLLDATIDASDVLCDDITAASAALLSARFPFVSPSGRIDRCDGGPRLPESVEVVDGGYRETSGASSVVEAWPRLGTELAAAAGRCVLPVFVQVDNGYRSDEIAPSGSSGQILAPVVGLGNTMAGYEAAARSASRRQFDQWFTITTRAHPGSQAPLGWVLSGDAKADLENQLRVNAEGIRAVRALLDGGVPSDTPSAICPGETPLAAGENPGAAAQ